MKSQKTNDTSVGSIVVPKKRKATKKSAQKEATHSKKAVKKRTSKVSLPIEKSSRDISRKIQIIERITKAKETPVKKGNVVAQRPTMAIVKSSVSRALVVPFKFNVDHTQLASNLARYAGVALVLIGSVCTLYGMNGYTSALSLTAQVVSTTCSSGTPCSNDTTSGNGQTDSTSVDTTPDVDFAIGSGTTVLKGQVEIIATVPFATRIDIYAIEQTTHAQKTVGTLTKAAEPQWKKTWDTTATPDGTYRFKAVVQNAYGSYTHESSQAFLVENHTDESSSETTNNNESTDSTVATTTKTETAPDTLTSDIELSVSMSEPLKGSVLIKTVVESARSVLYTFRKSGTSPYVTLGNAYLGSDGVWKYSFDTTRVQNGSYDIRALVTFMDNQATYTSLSNIDVDNSVAHASTTTEEIQLTSAVPESQSQIEPSIKLVVPTHESLSGGVDVYFYVDAATFIEVYVLPQSSIVPRFLGLAKMTDDGVWRYRLETESLPNGAYRIFGNVRHLYGDTKSEYVSLVVFNKQKTTVTKENVSYVESLKNINAEVQALRPSAIVADEDDINILLKAEAGTTSDSSKDSTSADDAEEARSDKEVEDALLRHTDMIRMAMNEYADALREGDTKRSGEIIAKLERDRDSELARLSLREDTLSYLKDKMNELTTSERKYAEDSEELIRKRIGKAVFDDTDKDGISDYDELNLYKTDPFGADSDSDGFIDGVEVEGGYNPLDALVEAKIVFESPKEQGIERDDILGVDTIASLTSDDAKEGAASVHIAGRALPNSFVTLYIYSTPIIVTVKADENGAWTYAFDKVLEDGSHEIYVGMTDNAGKLVAKSKPFSFVKTAEAYTPIDAEKETQVVTNEAPPAFMSAFSAFVVGSLAVVVLGLALILIGLHIRPKNALSIAPAQ